MIDVNGYLNSDNMIGHEKGKVSGNQLLYSALTLLRYSEWDGVEGSIKNHFKSVGLPMNTPRNEYGLCSVDNFVGLALAARLVHPSIAMGIFSYGNVHPIKGPLGIKFRYVYNNKNSKWDPAAWIGRQPQIIASLYYAADVTPSLFARVWWVLTVLWSCTSTRKSRKEDWFLTYALVKTAEGRCGFISQCVSRLFRWRLRQVWGEIEYVYRAYFGDQSHPLCQ